MRSSVPVTSAFSGPRSKAVVVEVSRGSCDGGEGLVLDDRSFARDREVKRREAGAVLVGSSNPTSSLPDCSVATSNEKLALVLNVAGERRRLIGRSQIQRRQGQRRFSIGRIVGGRDIRIARQIVGDVARRRQTGGVGGDAAGKAVEAAADRAVRADGRGVDVVGWVCRCR